MGHEGVCTFVNDGGCVHVCCVISECVRELVSG